MRPGTNERAAVAPALRAAHRVSNYRADSIGDGGGCVPPRGVAFSMLLAAVSGLIAGLLAPSLNNGVGLKPAMGFNVRYMCSADPPPLTSATDSALACTVFCASCDRHGTHCMGT